MFFKGGVKESAYCLAVCSAITIRAKKIEQANNACSELANDPNCDTNEPPFALGGSLCAKGVHRFLRPVFSEPRTSS